MSINVTLPQLSTLNNTSILSQTNSNFATIQTALTDAVSRSGQSPNNMTSSLDMNNNQIINLPAPSTVNSPARLIDVVSNPTITVPGTGTSGHTVPFLDGNNTWSGTNTFNNTTSIPFVQTGIGAVAKTVDAKLKDFWVSVKDFGAVGDDSTDNTTAFTNAVNAVLANGGGTLFIPHGTYRLASFPTISNSNNINIKGEGAFFGTTFGSTLRHTSTTGDFIIFSNCQQITMEDIYFIPTVRQTSGYQLTFVNQCANSIVRRCRMDFVYNGILIMDSSNINLEYIQLRSFLGTQGILFTGTAAIGSFGLYLDHVTSDQPYPVRSIIFSDIKTWTQSTAFTAGQVINNNGNIYQCTQNGTSSGVGTGPAGFPAGSTPDSVFSTNITDGTCLWKFVCNNSLTWFINDNYANSPTLISCQWLNGAIAVLIQDTANTGTSFPTFFVGFDCGSDHPFAGGYVLNAGFSVILTACFIGSCLTNNGVLASTGFKGELQISNCRIEGNAGNGVLLQNGPQPTLITGSLIANNSGGTSVGLNHGISIAPNASHITIVGNRIGANSLGGNNQGFGIFFNSGSSDFVIIEGNDVSTNVNGGITIGTITGTHNVIKDNPGYNPVGVTAAATMGASPFTVTAGMTPETHYVRQSATNTATVTKGGQQIATLAGATTYYTFELGPNESYVTTWATTAPTFTKDVH